MDASNPSTQWVDGYRRLGLKVQWLSIKAQWEPALVQALAPMADDCLAILRRELAVLAADPETPPDWPALTARLAKDWATVARTLAHEVFNRARRAVCAQLP